MKDKVDALEKALGEILLQRRLSLGFTQKQLANLSGLHRTYISDIERGKRNISITTYTRISNALEMPVSSLMQKAEELVLSPEQTEPSSAEPRFL